MSIKKRTRCISMVIAAMLLCTILAGCGSQGDTNSNPPAETAPPASDSVESPSAPDAPTPSDSYHLYGETLVQQTGADDNYRCGDLELKADGTAVFTMYNRAPDSDEKTVMYTWSEGTWVQNADDTVSVSLNTIPDDGGHGEYDGGAGMVETQTNLEEGELLCELNSDSKLTVEVSVQSELITYAMTTYTAIELVAD